MRTGDELQSKSYQQSGSSPGGGTAEQTAATVRAWLRARVDADPQMRTAEQRKPIVPPTPDDLPDDTDLTFELTRSHNRITKLVQRLSARPGADPNPGRLGRRKATADALVDLLELDLQIERELLWPLAAEALDDAERWRHDDPSDEIGEQGERLRQCQAGTPEFDEAVEALSGAVSRHVALADALFLELRSGSDGEHRQEAGRRARQLLAGTTVDIRSTEQQEVAR